MAGGLTRVGRTWDLERSRGDVRDRPTCLGCVFRPPPRPRGGWAGVTHCPWATGHVRWDSELATGLSPGQCAGLPDDFPYTPCSIHSGLTARSFSRHSDQVPLLLSLRWLPLPREQSPSSSRRPEATGSGLVKPFKALPCSPQVTGCPLFSLPLPPPPPPSSPALGPTCLPRMLFCTAAASSSPPLSCNVASPGGLSCRSIHTLHTVV